MRYTPESQSYYNVAWKPLPEEYLLLADQFAGIDLVKTELSQRLKEGGQFSQRLAIGSPPASRPGGGR
jgi:hypothetical protein